MSFRESYARAWYGIKRGNGLPEYHYMDSSGAHAIAWQEDGDWHLSVSFNPLEPPQRHILTPEQEDSLEDALWNATISVENLWLLRQIDFIKRTGRWPLSDDS